MSKLRCLAARKYPDIVLSVELADGAQLRWRYEMAFSQDNNRNPVLKRAVVHRGGGGGLQRPDDDDRKDPARLSQAALEQINAHAAFRPVARFLETVLYLHLVPQIGSQLSKT